MSLLRPLFLFAALSSFLAFAAGCAVECGCAPDESCIRGGRCVASCVLDGGDTCAAGTSCQLTSGNCHGTACSAFSVPVCCPPGGC